MSAGRWLASLGVGFVFTSGLNWFVAEKFLNPIIKPGFGDLMREAGDTQIGVLTAGFALPVLAVAWLCAWLEKPHGWLSRGLAAGGIVSMTTFFGAYTFLSGWLRLPTGALCTTAIADTITVMLGAVLIAWIQRSPGERAAG
jgi:hypothetical protein